MTKIILYISMFLIFSFSALAQQTTEDFSIKGKKIIGIGTTIKSNRYLQGNNGIYKELSFDYGLGNFISVGIFVGHQERNYSFISLGSSGSNVYYYDQNFVPMGVRATLHISPFVHEQLGISLNPEKWDLYIRYYAGLALNSVDEKFDRWGGDLPSQQIDYRFFQADEDMNYSAGLLTGVRFYPLRKLGFFFEGGYGPMGNFNFGLVSKF